MNVIICVDNDNGMMFNNRRQSKDRILQEHIINMIGTKCLWLNSYSSKLFNDNILNIIVDENYLDNAEKDDYCFVEGKDISYYIEKVNQIIIFRWNRKYPADTFFNIDISQWTLQLSEDFAGYSHDKITKEIYKR